MLILDLVLDPDYLRRELDSRFLQSANGTSTGNNMTHPSNSTNPSHFPLLPSPSPSPSQRGHEMAHNEKLVSPSSSSSNKVNNEKMTPNMTNEQQMNQFLRNSVIFLYFSSLADWIVNFICLSSRVSCHRWCLRCHILCLRRCCRVERVNSLGLRPPQRRPLRRL